MKRYRESVRAASAKINIVSIVSREILESCGITHGSNSMLSDVINESNNFKREFNNKKKIGFFVSARITSHLISLLFLCDDVPFVYQAQRVYSVIRQQHVLRITERNEDLQLQDKEK